MSVERARTLRKHMTAPELALWFRLRELRGQGWHFRRQAPEGSYVLDFVCRSVMLIVEVDGAHHGDEPQRMHDEQRDRILVERGFRVLRFWANEVLLDADGVIEQILAVLRISGEQSGARPRKPPAAASPRHLQLSRLGLRKRADT